MIKIALLIHVRVDDWAAEVVIVTSNMLGKLFNLKPWFTWFTWFTTEFKLKLQIKATSN